MGEKKMTIRKMLSFLVVILLLNGKIRLNPIAPALFNELQVDSVGWVLELSPEIGIYGLELDGWYLTSAADTAYFIDNINTVNDYLIITQDSLLSPLIINPQGDSLVLHDSNDFALEWLVFGESSNSIIVNPQPHQSLSRYTDYAGPWGEDFYYLDNTPTLGFVNDTINAIGAIEGIVIDAAGIPIENVRIYYDYYYGMDSMFVYTDENGYFSFSHLANRKYFSLDEIGYHTQSFREQIYPDSTISLSIEMVEILQSIGAQTGPILNRFYLSVNYPNPFNYSTTFYYRLPLNTPVEILIYNIKGELVDRINYGYQDKGQYIINWNFQNLPSGVYYYQLSTPEMILNRKCILLK